MSYSLAEIESSSVIWEKRFIPQFQTFAQGDGVRNQSVNEGRVLENSPEALRLSLWAESAAEDFPELFWAFSTFREEVRNVTG